MKVIVNKKVEKCYLDYAMYVNSTRALPDYRDGLKLVQRRLIITGYHNRDNFVKCASIVGTCMSRYHPHGDSSIYGTLINMVNSVYPLFEGQGNFGGCGVGAAAMRYTEARISHLCNNLFLNFIKEIPYYENDLGSSEPEFLVTLIPYSLLSRTVGIGLGISTSMVPFDLKSLLKYIRWYYEPSTSSTPKIKLYNISGYVEADVNDIFNTGIGTVEYKPEVIYEWSTEDNKYITRIKSKDINVAIEYQVRSLFSYELLNGLVFVRNESTTDNNIVIGRLPFVKKISDEEIFKKCKEKLYRRITVNSYWNVNGVAKRMSAKEVLQKSCDNFNKYFKLSTLSKVKQLQVELRYHEIKNEFVKLKLDKINKKDIIKKLNIDDEVYNYSNGKSINSLDDDKKKNELLSEVKKLRDRSVTEYCYFKEGL